MNPVHDIYPICISNRSDYRKEILLSLCVNERCSKHTNSSICFKFAVMLKYVKLPCINSTRIHAILVRIFFPCRPLKTSQNCVQNFLQFFARVFRARKFAKNSQMFETRSRSCMNFFRRFQSLVSLNNAKVRIRIICDYSFNMADRRLKIWYKLFQIKYFHIINTKFDFVCGQISHAYPARPFELSS